MSTSPSSSQQAEYEQALAESRAHFSCKIGQPGQSRWYHFIVAGLIRPFLLAIRPWQRLRIEGKEHIPRSGSVLIFGTHESFFDPIVVVAKVWRPMTAYAKLSLFAGRFSWFYRGMGQIPLERGKDGATDRSIELGGCVLRQGGAVCIYPEGTRISGGIYKWHERVAIGVLALRPQTPVVVVAITYEKSWFGRTAVIRVSPPFTFVGDPAERGAEIMAELRNWAIQASGLEGFDGSARNEKERRAIEKATNR